MGLFGFNLVKEKRLTELLEAMTTYKRTLEDIGWINLSLTQSFDKDLIAGGYENMLKRCRLYYYNNPLAGHWIQLTTSFTFGQGISVPKAAASEIQEVINEFWNDPDNQKALTSKQSQIKLCDKLQYEGNLFVVLFVNKITGNVKVRIFDALEIKDIIKDSDDRLRPLFYKRSITKRKYNFTSDSYDMGTLNYVYYPDWQVGDPEKYEIPANKIELEAFIYHVKINCDINDKFGVPVLYRGLDWIKAHKDMAGDLATLVKSLSILAWKKKVKGTPAQVAALKSVLHARIDLKNVPPAAGSTQIENEAVDTSPINIPTGGIKIGETGLKQMQLMVCAASNIFYHYFGDPSTGNLATATSMELPMVKTFLANQECWSGIYNDILQFVVNKKIEAGKLKGEVELNKETNRKIYKTELDRFIDTDFPPILEKELKALAEALQIGIINNLISGETAAQIFQLAAGVNNVDEELEKMFPASKEGKKKEEPKKEEDLKEKIETPEKKSAKRLASKNDHVLQRMNGYRKALAGHYRQFQARIKQSLQTDGTEGKIVGNIKDLDSHLKKLSQGMQNAAKIYFPIAIDIGKKFLQSHLKEAQIKESIFEAKRKDIDLLTEKLTWNKEFIEDSLIPDIEKNLVGTMRRSYPLEAEFKTMVGAATAKFEGRIEQYAGAFWTIEEAAVKKAGKGTGIKVNWVGSDDGGTCDGCANAFSGNPYLIDDAPEPGSFECNGRCRHALQIVEE